jgi:ATP-binding cassette subfamily B protein
MAISEPAKPNDTSSALSAQSVSEAGADTFPIPGQVVFRHVGFRYAGASGEEVLQDIDFTVEPGQTVAILGATGVGKSTLVNLIPRFYDVTEGEVLVHGRNVKTYPLDALRGSIGTVLQQAVLFSGTVRDNIRWGRQDASDEAVEEAAKAAQAHDFVMGFPDGYDTMIGQQGVNCPAATSNAFPLRGHCCASPPF